MKVYTFTVIAIGIMFLFNIAGLDTGTSQILDALGGVETTGGFQGTNLWIAIAVFVAASIAVAVSRISIGGFSLNTPIEALIATFIGGIYLLFASDLYSIVSYIGGIAGTTSWEYYTCWAVIVPILAGYTISIVEFIRGND